MKHDLILGDAVASLYPQAKWHIYDNDYQQFTWLEKDIPKPTKEELEAELERLKAQEQQLAYRDKRRAEYPPFEEYLDGVVKGDQAQIQAYIDACLAVKEKYPKSS